MERNGKKIVFDHGRWAGGLLWRVGRRVHGVGAGSIIDWTRWSRVLAPPGSDWKWRKNIARMDRRKKKWKIIHFRPVRVVCEKYKWSVARTWPPLLSLVCWKKKLDEISEKKKMKSLNWAKISSRWSDWEKSLILSILGWRRCKRHLIIRVTWCGGDDDEVVHTHYGREVRALRQLWLRFTAFSRSSSMWWWEHY